MKKFVGRAIGATKLAVKAKGPTILVVTGVTAMGASVIMASKATLRLEDALEPVANDLHDPSWDQATIDEKQVVVKKSVIILAKHYAIPAITFCAGAGMVFGGHHLMIKRNSTLALGLSATLKAFDAYRSNVRNHKGDEFDQAMLNGYKTKTVVDPQTGEAKVVTERDWDTERSPYNRVFEEGASTEWVPDLGMNRMTISNAQRNANRLLHHQNYLYLNDVYRSLGMRETDIGQVVGWKARYLPDGSREIPRVDFGLDKAMSDDWKYAQNYGIYLDFNCQGLIVGGAVQKALEKA